MKAEFKYQIKAFRKISPFRRIICQIIGYLVIKSIEN